jgi:glutathionylspermidine synthase
VQRVDSVERGDWRTQAATLGFAATGEDGARYWDERAYYRFSLAQIEDHLEAPTGELLAMCYRAVEHILGQDALLRRLAIPEWSWDYARLTWRRRDKDLYGRFDLYYDGTAPPKLYEFNADTPTALFEAAVFQWQWLEQGLAAGTLPAGADQYNSIHERLIEAFRQFGLEARTLHFSGMLDDPEDRWTIDYLRDCASQAGLATALVAIGDIGITADRRFTDLDDRIITDLFKLYPWEWLLAEPFGPELCRDGLRLIEPAWKLTLSNKGLLAVLWDMYPGHQLLLPAFFEDDPRAAALGGARVRKPLLGREGVDIAIGSAPPARLGPYGAEGHIVQELRELPSFAGRRPVIGSWVVGGRACGIGIREDDSPITGNLARFVPHLIHDGD